MIQRAPRQSGGDGRPGAGSRPFPFWLRLDSMPAHLKLESSRPVKEAVLPKERLSQLSLAKIRSAALAENVGIATDQPVNYTLKFILQGVKEPFCYRVIAANVVRGPTLSRDCWPTQNKYWNWKMQGGDNQASFGSEPRCGVS